MDHMGGGQSVTAFDEALAVSLPLLLDLLVHFWVAELEEEVLLLDLHAVLLVEVQLLEPLLELREQSEEPVAAHELPEEPADVEAGLEEHEVHDGQRLQHPLPSSPQVAQAEVHEFTLRQQLLETLLHVQFFVLLAGERVEGFEQRGEDALPL